MCVCVCVCVCVCGWATVFHLSMFDLIIKTRVQILDEADCISHSINTLGKGMNPNILPPAMGK